MKNKNLMIIGGVAIVALIAGFALMQGKGGGGNLIQNAVQGGPFSGSLKAAVALGVPMKCTYNVEGHEYSGVIKGKQYKGLIKNPDGTEGTVIMKDNCIYTWGNTDSQGFMTCFDPAETDIWDESEETLPVNYNCNPAVVTDAEFALPAEVDFLSLDELMKGAGVDLEM